MPRQKDGWSWMSPNRTRSPNPAPSALPWCTRTRVSLHSRAPNTTRKPRLFKNGRGELQQASPNSKTRTVRCPDCGRRLTTTLVDIESGYGDWWEFLPPHKIRKTKAKLRTKKTTRSGSKRSARGR